MSTQINISPAVGQAPGQMERRDFMISTVGGFLLGFFIDGSNRATLAQGIPATQTAVNGYIIVNADETVTIMFGGCELGQGSMTALAQMAAEDLMVDWSAVRVAQAPPSAISYLTAGSSAVLRRWQTLRTAGATARDLLIAAAANYWNCAVSDCFAQSGKVMRKSTPAVLTYGFLSDKMTGITLSGTPLLVDNSAFRIIGKPIQRVDIPSKVNGSAKFGIDIWFPNMVFAVIKHGPIGAVLAKTPVKPSAAIALVPVTASDNRGAVAKGSQNAVAVVSTNTWQAMQLASNLQLSWNTTGVSSVDSSAYLTLAQNLVTTGTGNVAETVGSAPAALASAATKFDFTYTFPYLAHATLEPLNCTVLYTGKTCEVWAPTQAASLALATVAAVTNLPTSAITIHTTFLGGGLGRKIEQDFISQAVQTAMALPNTPVKLTWPRGEDFGHDNYRPMAVIRMQAGLDSAGNVASYIARNVSPSILGQRGRTGLDTQATEGLTGLRYNFAARFVDQVALPSGVPVGFWRSVGHSFNCFAVESLIDEIAVATGRDPLALRQQLCMTDPRATALLQSADTASAWRHSLPAGHAWGIAMSDAFGTLACQVVEVSAATATSLTVNRVALVVDCGFVVNPNQMEAQMQGGIVHGLGAALWGNITFKNGAASVNNFSRYRMVRRAEMPQVTVTMLNSSTAPLGGGGEPGVPAIAPAVAAAYYRLTKTRMRTLPFFPTQSVMGD